MALIVAGNRRLGVGLVTLDLLFYFVPLPNMVNDIHYRREYSLCLFSEYSSHDIMRNGEIHRSRWHQQEPLTHLTTEEMEASITSKIAWATVPAVRDGVEDILWENP